MSDNGKNTSGNTANVIFLDLIKPEKKRKTAYLDFESLVRKNQENIERLKSERNKSNLSVIRSYRLKNKSSDKKS